MELITTATEINKAIDSVQRRGKKLDDDIQLTALSCLNHIEQHGDVTLICRLFNVMPKGSRRNALAQWALAFGKVQLNDDKDTKKELPFKYNKASNTDLEGAAESPWYTFKPEKPVDEEFDLAAKIQALMSQARKAQQQGKKIKGAEWLDTLAAGQTESAGVPTPMQD